MTAFLDFFWPAHPLHIERSFSPIRLTGATLHRRHMNHVDELIAASSYRDPAIRSLIRRMKFSSMRSLTPIIARLMIDAIPGLLIAPKSPILVPIPLHWTRRILRGFNQSELLARDISTHVGWPVVSLLQRTRPTGYQSHRQHREKHAAMNDVFAVVSQNWKPVSHVVLIDDICTTGATLESAAVSLKNAGVCRVSCLVAALG